MHEGIDRTADRRHMAIKVALDIIGDASRTADDVLAIARQVDDFLRGK